MFSKSEHLESEDEFRTEYGIYVKHNCCWYKSYPNKVDVGEKEKGNRGKIMYIPSPYSSCSIWY